VRVYPAKCITEKNRRNCFRRTEQGPASFSNTEGKTTHDTYTNISKDSSLIELLIRWNLYTYNGVYQKYNYYFSNTSQHDTALTVSSVLHIDEPCRVQNVCMCLKTCVY